MRPNTVKRQLREGEPSLGTWVMLGSPLAAEYLAHQGFDWLNVEQEHSPFVDRAKGAEGGGLS